ncbi:endonuclease/exonuclease/phosphatase family protein [Allostreptomyces psammosilenae]|uniref:Exonuclease III n=1 Tax=Allostreptomyces psammosilenae TaxID=1892865 RepID=A0A852ZUT8_9ACTN|nr:endonuclease/exonuclease/phosphatase family protein [Allostreptomyces psammosilenae]NYI05685.1 exonuclease III [Allostreptomyces psammosilenae]
MRRSTSVKPGTTTMREKKNMISLFTSEEIRPGADIPVFYQSESGKPNNWIDLRRVDGAKEKSVTFQYAPGCAGVVTFSGLSTDGGKEGGKGITPGDYALYLYEGNAADVCLDGPVRFSLSDAPYFCADSFSTANIRVGERCDVDLTGILEAFGHDVTFEKAGGDDWLDVTEAGKVTGEAPEDFAGRPGHIVVTAQADDTGAETSVALTVPVRDADGPLVDQLRIATWNLWYDGDRVYDGLAKVMRVLLEQDVDIVGLQEVHDDEEHQTVKDLAARLGWYHHMHPDSDVKDVGLLSRYPVDEKLSGSGTDHLRTAVKVGDLVLQICGVHLNYDPYSPYEAPVGKRRFTRAVREAEKATEHKEEMTGILQKIRTQLGDADASPVLVLGDFNCPSHLDWESALHSGDMRNWPATTLLEEKGFADSYRVAHPDRRAYPGLTWSPAQLWNNREVDPPRVEPQDRIDFVFHKGRRLDVLASHTQVAGNPAPAEQHAEWGRYPHYWYNRWPSDHAAVITTYRVNPKTT